MKAIFTGVLCFIFIAASFALGFGWCMNIVELVQGNEEIITKLIRVIGIFIAPVGGIMGWL